MVAINIHSLLIRYEITRQYGSLAGEGSVPVYGAQQAGTGDVGGPMSEEP